MNRRKPVALPKLTDEQRKQALAKAAEARKARAELKASLKRGDTTLKDVLEKAETDEIIGKTKVSALLEALPKVGKVKAREIMEDLEIAQTRRLRGLGDRQRRAPLERFGFSEQSSMTSANHRGRLVVLPGAFAVGKSTVVSRVRHGVDRLYFSVSMTTRAPRPGEQDGVDYFFVSPEEFQRRIDAGEMLEWADIHGGLQRSGTPAAPVKEALEDSRPVLVEVDLEGARNVKKALPDAELVFLAPPSWEVLVDRLTGRGTEPQEVIERRLDTAREELACQSEFDRVIVNDNLDDAVAAITAI